MDMLLVSLELARCTSTINRLKTHSFNFAILNGTIKSFNKTVTKYPKINERHQI